MCEVIFVYPCLTLCDGLPVPPPGPTCRADVQTSHTDEGSSRVARRRELQRRRAGVGRTGGQHTSHLGEERV